MMDKPAQKNINFLGPDPDREFGQALLDEACDMFRIKKEDIDRANVYPRKMVVVIVTKDGWRARFKKKIVPHPLADVREGTPVSGKKENKKPASGVQSPAAVSAKSNKSHKKGASDGIKER